MAGVFFDNQIVTQTATESIGLISQVRIAEPNITDNLTGDITTACSLYVHAAPTEGEDNYALYVKAGASRFGGDVAIGSVTAPVTKLHVADNANQTVMPGTQQAIISANSVTSTTNWQLAIEGDNDSGILFTEDNAKRGMVGYDAGKSQAFVGDTDGDARWAVGTSDNTARCYTHDIQALIVDSTQVVTFTNGIFLDGNSGASNELDDYEEGSWTPVLIGNTSGTKTADSNNVGRYTKIGNLCTVSGTLDWDGGDAIVGIPCLSGFPFATRSQSNGRDGGVVGQQGGLTFPSDGNTYIGWALGTDQNRTNAYIFALREESYGTGVVASSGTMYGFTITYQTAT